MVFMQEIFMPILYPFDSTVGSRLFLPASEAMLLVTSSRRCPELSDLEFIQLGVSRVLSQAKSGRDFLQSHAEAGGKLVRVNHFFELLKSCRRLALCVELNQLLLESVARKCDDPFSPFIELAKFDLYAGDGHYHAPAAHDDVKGKSKQPVGHFFIFNMRSRALHHLELALSGGERKREHDMHVLKRTDLRDLRFGAKKGRKVLIVWDKAGIDFRFWHDAKQIGLYFLSREKDNMSLETIGVNGFDKSDLRNEGVLSDELVSTSQGVAVRRVIYHDPVGGVTYTYLTTEYNLPPGLIALLYKRRWDIEKVFDDTENKLQEGKSWASSPNAKKIQGQMIAIAYNLILLLETDLENIEQIRNEPEIERRAKRLEAEERRLANEGKTIPFVYRAINRITQRGVKLIRWLRNHIYTQCAWADAINKLRRIYATM